MLPAEFEPAIPANERPQTNALDRAATGIGGSSPYSTPIISEEKRKSLLDFNHVI
jgi:hypothetical protein